MTQVGSVYGEALYTLAVEESLAERILSQLDLLDHAFAENPDFIRLLSSPSLSKEERFTVLDTCFRGSVHPYVLHFLKILTKKSYVRYFGHCRKAYEEHYNRDNGIVTVTAVTAVALTPEQKAKLTEKLSRITSRQIRLQSKVDPSVLGGVRLDYGGKRLDDTVAHRLETIRSQIKRQ